MSTSTVTQLDAGGSDGAPPLVRRLTVVHPGPPAAWVLTPGKLVLGRGDPPVVGRLQDALASRKHAELDIRPDSIELIDLGSRNGTFLNGQRVTRAVVRDGAVIRIGEHLLVLSEHTGRPGISLVDSPAHVGLARAEAEAIIDRAAPTTLAVLIMGPSGAGKERLARRVHEASARKGAFVAVNCATFSKDLLGSELFGHVKGAFSGAQGSRPGLFASADGGTLFLDEIAELPIEQQPALLRALQEQRIRPIGADRDVAVDVRIVAATHQDLARAAELGRFREDLYARLAGITVPLPGLSARREEILPLFFSFLEKPATLSVAAAERLLCAPWPRNVRQLQSVAAQVALFLEGGRRIEPGDLPAELAAAPAVGGRAEGDDATGLAPSVEVLTALLSEHRGNVAQVARALGQHRTQVYRWLTAHGLDAASFRREG